MVRVAPRSAQAIERAEHGARSQALCFVDALLVIGLSIGAGALFALLAVRLGIAADATAIAFGSGVFLAGRVDDRIGFRRTDIIGGGHGREQHTTQNCSDSFGA